MQGQSDLRPVRMGMGRIVGIALIGFLLLVTLVAGAWAASVLAIGSILVLGGAPFVLSRRERRQDMAHPGLTQASALAIIIALALAAASFVAFGVHAANSPEGRAAAARGEKERRIETAMEAARDRAEAIEERIEEEKEREAERAEQEAEAKERRSGVHCLSSWDGSYRPLVEVVQPAMRNPDSFEHAETRITPPDAEGNHRVIMTFRAENGFGGMNIEKAYAKVRHEDCSMVSAELAN